MPEDKQPEEKKVSAKVLKEFFGLKDGQKMIDFANELKELSTEEKEQLTKGIRDETFDY